MSVCLFLCILYSIRNLLKQGIYFLPICNPVLKSIFFAFIQKLFSLCSSIYHLLRKFVTAIFSTTKLRDPLGSFLPTDQTLIFNTFCHGLSDTHLYMHLLKIIYCILVEHLSRWGMYYNAATFCWGGLFLWPTKATSNAPVHSLIWRHLYLNSMKNRTTIMEQVLLRYGWTFLMASQKCKSCWSLYTIIGWQRFSLKRHQPKIEIFGAFWFHFVYKRREQN